LITKFNNLKAIATPVKSEIEEEIPEEVFDDGIHVP